mgnify:FL=1
MQCGKAVIETFVHLDFHKLTVVEPCTAESALVKFETKRFHKVQLCTGVGAKAYDIASIRRNLRLKKNQGEHEPCILPDGEGKIAPRIRIIMTVALKPNPNLLQTDFCGLGLASPIVLLSGCVGFGEEYTRIEGFSNRDVGAIVLKGTTLEPRLGNSPHRVYETPEGMLNAIGLQNPGVDKVVDDILPELDFSETRFMANVCGSTIDDYEAVTRRFDDSSIDAIEINISCPNIKKGGVSFGNYPDMSAQVIEACRRATNKPIIAKLSPNQTDIQENARLCIEAGADALAVINTVMGMAIDVKTREPVIGNVRGGLSGPAIKPIALLKVHQVYQIAGPKNIPIIGQGGITTVDDALEFIIAGSTTIGIGTALFYDPLLCRKINAGITEYLARHELGSVMELVGSLNV